MATDNAIRGLIRSANNAILGVVYPVTSDELTCGVDDDGRRGEMRRGDLAAEPRFTQCAAPPSECTMVQNSMVLTFELLRHLIIHFPAILGVSERLSEQMCAA